MEHIYIKGHKVRFIDIDGTRMLLASDALPIWGLAVADAAAPYLSHRDILDLIMIRDGVK